MIVHRGRWVRGRVVSARIEARAREAEPECILDGGYDVK